MLYAVQLFIRSIFKHVAFSSRMYTLMDTVGAMHQSDNTFANGPRGARKPIAALLEAYSALENAK
jgi:hypothetical protein